jgi:hypothetical protein
MYIELVKNATGINKKLQQIYGQETISRTQALVWLSSFKTEGKAFQNFPFNDKRSHKEIVRNYQ